LGIAAGHATGRYNPATVRQYSPEHVAALAVIAVAAALAVWAPRRHSGPWVVVASRALAFVILGAYVLEYVANIARGTWDADFNLPLQLTDAVTLVAVGALWSPRPLLVELVYFWALTASLQAVLTPDLNRAFPSVFYFTYFTTHCGAVVAAFLLVFGREMWPRPGAVWRVYAVTAAFAALAGIGDTLTGGNYMYLRHKPARSSLLDVMGPWPVYIAAGAAFGLAVFGALAALARGVRDSGAARSSAWSPRHRDAS
jgi:hypothetical integral membrane protein (TIGR02206 family)